MEPIICLAGPTAAGKTAAVMELAANLPIEIISVDSANIYRKMDIGTAKPSAEERALVPHHLIDILDPAETYSASDFCSDALRLIEEIKGRERIPILAGGTMMYFKALREGLNDLPSRDSQIREKLDKEAQEVGWPEMHDRLKSLDPVTAERLAPNDSQRIQRALEVITITGKPLSELLAKQQDSPQRYDFKTISLEPSDRSWLHERIALRFHQMMEEGFLNEVKGLHSRDDLHVNLPSIRCVGYRQLWEHLEGAYDLDTAVEKGIVATRQLAKRQITWLRALPERASIDSMSNDAAQQVKQKIYETLSL